LRRAGLILLIATAAHAETRPHYGGSVDGALLGAPSTFDPVVGQSLADITVSQLVFDTLYRIGADGVAQPLLAAAQPTVDGNRAHIPLRKGVRFHDGTTLTATDVARSLDRVIAIDPWLLAPVASVSANGDAIDLVMRGPGTDIATLLALPQAAVTKGGKDPGARPVGSGPFAFESIDRTRRELRLRAFDDCFNGRPYLDKLVLRWFDTPDAEAKRFEVGDSQISARGVAAFAGQQPKYHADEIDSPTAVLVFVGFGRAHAFDADKDLRRAIDASLARDSFTDITLGERVVPAELPLPVEAGGSSPDGYARKGDPAKAHAAVDAAMKRFPDLGKQRLEILVEDSRPDDRVIAERVANALDGLGIPTAITAVTAPVLRDRVAKGTCDLWIGQLVSPVTSSVAWWGAAFAAGNDSWPVKPLANGFLDPQTTAKAFADHLPIIPIMFRSLQIWHRSDVRGLGFDASASLGFADAFLHGNPVKVKLKP
jgi:ABC-type transport system substrate-binding protein